MSWGIKITILYTGFAALIMTMVGLTMREQIDLVTPDYYEQELHYQDRIDAIERTRLLEEQPTWEVGKKALRLHLPASAGKQEIVGHVYFFRPSDSRLDQTIALPAAVSGIREIPLGKLKKGVYKMQISWKQGQTDYYTEGIIQIH
jgi:nitrogen fixation protein FixH